MNPNVFFLEYFGIAYLFSILYACRNLKREMRPDTNILYVTFGIAAANGLNRREIPTVSRADFGSKT